MGSIQRGLELVSVATQLWLIIEDLVKIFLKLKNDDGVRKQKFRYIIEQYFGEQKCELWQVEDNESQKMTQDIFKGFHLFQTSSSDSDRLSSS